MSTIKEALEERHQRYGDFRDNSNISQALQSVLRECRKFERMEPFHQEALTQICVKIARIMNGDHNYADNYIDIAGYATLAAEYLKREERAKEQCHICINCYALLPDAKGPSMCGACALGLPIAVNPLPK